MNRTAWKCFTAFVPLSYKILMCIGTILLAAGNFYLSLILGEMGGLIVASFVMVFIMILDYIPFSGISVRHQKRMEIFKSSFYGTLMVEKILYGSLKSVFQ